LPGVTTDVIWELFFTGAEPVAVRAMEISSGDTVDVYLLIHYGGPIIKSLVFDTKSIIIGLQVSVMCCLYLN
jgi:hypothetical protein